ncbi:hypothetical protein Droror1_Dr00004690 [Drosera rotundifolia]
MWFSRSSATVRFYVFPWLFCEHWSTATIPTLYSLTVVYKIPIQLWAQLYSSYLGLLHLLQNFSYDPSSDMGTKSLQIFTMLPLGGGESEEPVAMMTSRRSMTAENNIFRSAIDEVLIKCQVGLQSRRVLLI